MERHLAGACPTGREAAIPRASPRLISGDCRCQLAERLADLLVVAARHASNGAGVAGEA
jgi:hypothetical protein